VLIRILLLVALLAAPGFRPAFSHEGHSHGDEPAPLSAAAPRTEAHSELTEIVAVLGPDRRLWLYLDRHATSEPIYGATVQITLDSEDLGMATRAGEAIYVPAIPALERPGQKNLVFTITAGEDMDLLPATLEIPAAAEILTAAPESSELLSMALREPYLWAAGLLLFLFGVAIGRAAAPRPLPPLVVEPSETATRPHALPSGAPMRAPERARDTMRALLDLPPAKVRLLRKDRSDEEMLLAVIEVSDRLHIRPGDKVLLNSAAREGAPNAYESVVTGEAVPVSKLEGDGQSS
jgi:cobalt-zinc-cadmium efflux system membrane fusion protein